MCLSPAVSKWSPVESKTTHDTGPVKWIKWEKLFSIESEKPTVVNIMNDALTSSCLYRKERGCRARCAYDQQSIRWNGHMVALLRNTLKCSGLKKVWIFTLLVLNWKIHYLAISRFKNYLELLFVLKTFQVPSLEIVAILVESQLKAKSSTPDLWPCSSKARFTAWKSPDLLKVTSQTFTSGAKPRK